MPAYCRSCGQAIKNADGSDNFDRQFCLPPSECAKNFRRDQLRDKRAKTKQQKRCTKCLQPIVPKELREQFTAWLNERAKEKSSAAKAGKTT